MRISHRGLVLAAVATLSVLAAPASAHAALSAEIAGTAKGVAIVVQSIKGTECAPHGWEQPASTPCHLLVHGTWSGTSNEFGPLHGRYTGRLTINTGGHAPGCLETSGTLTYTVRAPSGKLLGRIVAPLDPSDSEVCEHEPPVRTYFFRADVQGGTGVFAGAGGNWLVTGSGQPRPHGHAYVDDLSVSGNLF
jgi:hypothetical protein